MIEWQEGASVSVFDLQSAFGPVVEAIESDEPEWVVLQDYDWSGISRAYAFRPTELRTAASIVGYDAAVRMALDSPLQAEPALLFGAAGEEPLGGSWSAGRAIRLDASGRVSTVGEVLWETGWTMRGGHGAPPPPPPVITGGDAAPESFTVEPVECLLSAQGPSVLALGDERPVEVRLELAEEGTPFAEHIAAGLDPDVDVTALLFAEPPDRVERTVSLLKLKPPATGAPTQDAFVIRGLAAGPVKLTVAFRQGGSSLGALTLDCEVRAHAAGERPAALANATAEGREPLEDSGLVLLVEERATAGEVCYRYRVFSEAFGCNYEHFDSEPFRNADGQATVPKSYVQAVYRQLETRALRNIDDVKLFERELRGVGVDLCRQLLPADLVELLWDHRDRIRIIEVNAGEPYVPWELVRLRHPRTREVDDRYLAAYGLVRTFPGKLAPRRLERGSWHLLVGDYEEGTSASVGTERTWLLETLAKRGLTAQELAADPHVLLDAVADAQFDVLHLATHAAADLDDISSSSIVLSERGAEATKVDVRTVDAEAGRWTRRPLVFLNACQTGRQSPALSDWGGWSKTFWDAGAGAFVGTSWSVRDRPAAEFARGFYEGLLAGKPLVDAAVQARERAGQLPDASWLAFTVWGRPAAAMDPAPETG